MRWNQKKSTGIEAGAPASILILVIYVNMNEEIQENRKNDLNEMMI